MTPGGGCSPPLLWDYNMNQFSLLFCSCSMFWLWLLYSFSLQSTGCVGVCVCVLCVCVCWMEGGGWGGGFSARFFNFTPHFPPHVIQPHTSTDFMGNTQAAAGLSAAPLSPRQACTITGVTAVSGPGAVEITNDSLKLSL